METIKIQGARIHNLKQIDLIIPKQELVAITGISGSGKSSLAFDIVFEEGKNQYLRSIGILAGLDNEDKFDAIEGIGPAVAVCQNTTRQSNPRSTVGTKTGILNQLALLYASDGREKPVPSDTNTAGLALLYASDGKAKEKCDLHHKPGVFLYTTMEGMCLNCQGRGSYYELNLEQLIPDRNTSLREVYESLGVTDGYVRILKKKYGTYFETAFWELPDEIQEEVTYGTYENGKQSYCLERILYNAYKKGEAVEDVYGETICEVCQGERIGQVARKVLLGGKQIGELGKMTLTALLDYLNKLPEEELTQFGRNVVKNTKEKIAHLIRFRLGHLTLYREIASLSGGELQRVFLHLHLESRLDSLIYVFDEPLAGLHPAEKQSVIEAVKELRDLGNTVIVVEHDKEMMRHAEHIIEIGPKAGVEGGRVVFQGNYQEYEKADTLLSTYVSGKRVMPERRFRRQFPDQADCLTIEHANVHYLKDLTVTFPLHAIVGIAGLSGSGKSSLITETLVKRLISAGKDRNTGKEKRTGTSHLEHHRKENQEHSYGILGSERVSGVVTISQNPIGKSVSSTPASYIGIWDKIRELFANQPEAQRKNMQAGHFSFHSKGACPDCGGSGYERIFLTADFSLDKICPTCQGNRFQKESLTITFCGKTIVDVLQMSIAEAALFFADQSSILKPLRMLEQMGMGYLTLGQPTSSLSGGEAQRVKLAKELGRQRKGNTLYVLDEPTTGLSLYDTAQLLELLDQLIAGGNSVIVIEHHVEVLKSCDYLIELGPEGGDKGGEVIAQGTPLELHANPNSRTGKYLI